MNRYICFVSICIFLIACNGKSENKDEAIMNDSISSTTTATTSTLTPPEQTKLPEPTVPAITKDSTGKLSLYGVWVLHAYNSIIQYPSEYPSGLPYIKLDSATNTISGFAGCNGISGSFMVSGKQLAFSRITNSNLKCNQQKVEDEFMAFFSEKRQGFEFVQGFLYFRGAGGKNFTFRQIQ